MTLTSFEIEFIADALAERIISRLGGIANADAFIDSHEAAAILGCSKPTVERLTRSGEIPSVKIGRLRRYRRSALLNLRKEKEGSNHGE